MALWDKVAALFTTPFVGTLDLTHLFLLVGLVIVFLALWTMVFSHIASAASEI